MKINSKVITFIALSLILISLSIAGVLAYQAGLLSAIFTSDPDIVPKKVKITNISPDYFTVTWITNSEVAGTVIYGQGNDLEQKQLDDRDQLTGSSSKYKTHHITVNNLKPSTTYQFKIVSTEKEKIFDENGMAYKVVTAPKLEGEPPSDIINGTIYNSNEQPAEGSIVYIMMENTAPLSTLVKKDGSFLLSLANAYSKDYTTYAEYSPNTTNIDLLVQGKKSVSKALVTTANIAPVPKIVLGENYDFTSSTNMATSESSNKQEETPEIFLQDLSDETTASQVEILNPSYEGEELSSTTPQFIGTGPVDTVLTIKVISTTVVRGTALVDSDGNWTYSPNEELSLGTQTLEVKYTDEAGDLQSITRKFVVVDGSTDTGLGSGSGGSKYSTGTLPSYEATPSATPKPTLKPTPTPTPRAAMPDTDQGTPVSGSTSQTIIMLLSGLLLLGGGLYAKKSLATDSQQ